MKPKMPELTEDITCPHCGHMLPDGPEDDKRWQADMVECSECGKWYDWYLVPRYGSRKMSDPGGK